MVGDHFCYMLLEVGPKRCSESDDRALLAAPTTLAATEPLRVHADVLMTNHVHLPATPETDHGPGRLIRSASPVTTSPAYLQVAVVPAAAPEVAVPAVPLAADGTASDPPFPQ